MLTPQQRHIWNMNIVWDGKSVNSILQMQKESLMASAKIESDLTEIKGVGEWTQKILAENGIRNKEELALVSEEEIVKLIDNPLTQRALVEFIKENTLWTTSKTTDSETEIK